VATRKYEKELFEKAGLPNDLNGNTAETFEDEFAAFAETGGLDKWLK
jgi:hypothetical protein